jgi:hypothetical protein
MPEQPPDSGVVNVRTPARSKKPLGDPLPPPKMVNVTPSAEMGPSQPIPQITAQEMQRLQSLPGVSVTFQIPLIHTHVTFAGMGLLLLVGGAAALAPAGG